MLQVFLSRLFSEFSSYSLNVLCFSLSTDNLIALSFPHSVDDRDPEHKNKIDVISSLKFFHFFMKN